ncbi:heterokaryon incompatibility protein-domain-containing protein, partial [Boeremia exigua]|uniref:heterokaryon incompatibility protein-domain-containing protein n=1 Tax=Boeremia exigua TaxID=749465 RepID=UPI001E8E69A6
MSRTWLRTCIHEHKNCGPAQVEFRPTRLLQLNGAGRSVRLCEGAEIPESVQYVTLSHCWGGDVPGKLTKQNINSLRSGISLESLGQTFQDAVQIALELCVEFLWIDSFCIIQDSYGDWQSESVKMAHVYGNSTCNIAATSAANDSEGCFRMHNPGALQAIRVGVPNKRNDQVHRMCVTNVQHWMERFRKEPLMQRAWVLQERLLSPRNLHYDRDQLIWECNELLATETFPRGFGSLLSARKRPLRVPLNSTLRNAQEEEISGQALHEIWRPIVNTYASTDITKPTDRLVALHGVGMRIEHICGWSYVAGMFLKNLQSQLCWAANGHHDAQRPEKVIVPSWSWLSV